VKKDAIPEIENLEGATSSRFREEVDSIIITPERLSGLWSLEVDTLVPTGNLPLC